MEIQSIFLKYLLLPVVIVVSIVLLVFVNKKKQFVPDKKLIIGVLILGLPVAVPGALGFLGLDYMPWGYIICQFYELAMGCLFVYLMTKYYPKELLERKLFIIAAMFTSLLLGFYLFELLFNWLSDVYFGLWAASGVADFAVPLLFWWAYAALTGIPTEIYKIWQYPVAPVHIDIDHLDFNRMLVLELELFKHTDDPEPIKVKAKAPGNMVFGNWFYKFIEDYNLKFPKNPVHYKGDYNESYRWIFFIKTSFFKRNLFIDPDLDILDNGISEKFTIYAKRVSENEMEQEISGEKSIMI